MRPTPLGRLTSNIVPLEPPTFENALADIEGDEQVESISNMTLAMLVPASSPKPVTVREVETPADPANTVKGEKDVTFATYNNPLPALKNVVFDPAR